MKIELDLTEKDLELITEWLGDQGWEETYRVIEEKGLKLNADKVEDSLFKLYRQLCGDKI